MSVDNSSFTILIVDDVKDNIDLLTVILRKANYKSATAYNGETAIAATKSVKPDLILLDVAMPDIDGFTVCKILKEDSATSGIPIIFLTASNDVSYVIKGFSLGAVDYVAKPFNSDELLMRIKTHLTIRRLQNELERANENLEHKVEERTKELLAAKEMAEMSAKLKSEFLSQISHEIRTPLNAVITSAGIIELELHEHINDFLEPLFVSLKTGSKRIIRTVDLILNTSQVHTNSYEMSPAEIDLVELLRITSSFYQVQAREKKLKFELDFALPSAQIWGDNYSVTQIFEQLFDNALNYTSNGFIRLSLKEENGKYLVSVEDSGMGISPSFRNQLFTLFTQEQSGYTRPYDGNGLGLALVKKFCDLNKAQISLESEKNKGSRFIVAFDKFQ